MPGREGFPSVRFAHIIRFHFTAAMTTTTSAPRWMRNVLVAASAYNVLWGAFAVLFPSANAPQSTL